MIVVVNSDGQPIPVGALKVMGGITVLDLGDGAVQIGGPATYDETTGTAPRTAWKTFTWTHATRTYTQTIEQTRSQWRTRTRTHWITCTRTRSYTNWTVMVRTRTKTVTSTGTVWGTRPWNTSTRSMTYWRTRTSEVQQQKTATALGTRTLYNSKTKTIT